MHEGHLSGKAGGKSLEHCAEVHLWVQEGACENCEQSKTASEAIARASAAAREAAEAEAVADAVDRAEAAAAAAADAASGKGKGKGKKVPKFERLRLTGEASEEDTALQCAAEARLLQNVVALVLEAFDQVSLRQPVLWLAGLCRSKAA